MSVNEFFSDFGGTNESSGLSHLTTTDSGHACKKTIHIRVKYSEHMFKHIRFHVTT